MEQGLKRLSICPEDLSVPAHCLLRHGSTRLAWLALVLLVLAPLGGSAQRLSDAAFGVTERFATDEAAESPNYRLSQPTFEKFAGVAGSAELTMQIGWLPTTVEEQLPPPDLLVNDLDLLTDVAALHGETLEFLVSAENLTEPLTFTLDRSSPTAQLVEGELSLIPYGAGTALFRFTPSPSDLTAFDLVITARDSEGAETTGEFTVAPYPILPAEESIIRSVIPAPDPESADYVATTQVQSAEPEMFNGHSRLTRSISVAAKALVLGQGHANRIFASFDSSEDIKTLELFAERVVLRNPMRLPSTTINIHAREVIYENDATFVDAAQVNHLSGPIIWLQPPTLRMILAYARDLFISGRGTETRAILAHYRDFLEGMVASSSWAEYPEEAQNEFDQMHGEMTTMLWNLDRNLDYFGHPAGWVPNLSFEVNLTMFSSEIGPAIRLLYLSYWLGNVAKQVEAKVTAMTTGRVALHDELKQLQTDLETTQTLIPDLEARSGALTADIATLQQRIKDREEQLRREYEKSKKKNKWRKIAKQAGAIMQVFPVGQPVLASIGTGLNVISSLDKNSSLGDWTSAFGQFAGIAKTFTKANFEKSWDSFAEFGKTLKSIDPRDIQWTVDGLKDYYKQANDLRKTISTEVKEIQNALKKVEITDADAQAKLAEIKAAAPEFNQRSGDGVIDGLLDQIALKVAEQRELADAITEAVKTMNRLTDSIHRNILAMDSLSQDISKNNGALNLRAITYLKDMEKRAKERLLKYQYYMAKAFEYRLLRPYQGDLNLGTLFDRLVTLAEADPNGNGLLSQENFSLLEGLYEEQVAEIAAQLVERYNEEPQGSAYPFSYRLGPEQLEALNRGEPIRLSFIDEHIIPQDREDMQINDLHIGMKVTGVPELNDVFSLQVDHSGVSRMKLGTDVFLFRHSNTSSLNPFQREHPFHWEAEYAANTGVVTEKTPARGDVELLRFLLNLRGVPATDANLNLFSRAGMWSDFTVRRRDTRPGTLTRYRIDELSLSGTYDFRDHRTLEG